MIATAVDISALHSYLDSLDADARERVLSSPIQCWGYSDGKDHPECYDAKEGRLCVVDHAEGTGAWRGSYCGGPASHFDRLCEIHGLLPVVEAIWDYLR